MIKNDNEDKITRLKVLLDKHEIKYAQAKEGVAKGFLYDRQEEGKLDLTSKDLVINTHQPKGKMVKVLFEPKAKLADSLTYDITAWSIPYAHGFKAIASKTEVPSVVKSQTYSFDNQENTSAYAYISKWNSLNDATFLADLLKNNIVPRFSEKPFSIGGKSYDRGSLIILRNDNRTANFDENLIKIADRNMRQLHSVSSGFVDSGVDFGSYSVKPINKQKVALLSGESTSSLSFGEIWHFFETELNYPLTILDSDYFSRVNFDNYDVIIIPEGYYGRLLNENTLNKLTDWVSSGGTLIAIGSALNSFADKKGFALKSKKEEKEEDKKPNLTPYADLERESAKSLIAGAIFKSEVDVTHPLAFGYENTYFTLKKSSAAYDYLPYGNVAYFTKNAPNISGFAGKKVLEKLPETLLFGEERKGRGSVVYMVDNPLFRSFWDNGKLFLANAVFLLNSDTLK